MPVDFHSHLSDPYSIVCTDDATVPSSGLVRCAGLLPGKWTRQRQEKLIRVLEADSDLQMGEVGLDKRFTDTLPLSEQAEILSHLLNEAKRLQRSVCLHCVRATGPMLDILRSSCLRPFSVLWHGFSGSVETASELGKLGVIISVGTTFKGNLKELYKADPALVPETDYTGEDPKQHSIILEQRYSYFSQALGMSANDLEAHCKDILWRFSRQR